MGIRSSWLESWSPEIVAACFSLASIASLVGFLIGMEGRKVFNWYAITPNTVVAILATLARLSIGIVVTSALGQFKWIQYHQRPAPLTNFLLTAGASHGPWDSLKLLLRTRSMALVAIGCWTIILMLPFDAFAQQIVQFETTMLFHNESSSFIQHATGWNGGSFSAIFLTAVTENGTFPSKPDGGTMVLDFGMQAAILSGLNTDRDQLLQQLPGNCGSSECRWKGYESLATCSICNDVTSMMQQRHFEDIPMSLYAPLTGQVAEGDITEWYLPNGLTINNGDTELRSSSGPAPATVFTTQAVFNAAHTLTLQNLTTMLVSLSSLSSPPVEGSSGYSDWPSVPVRAQECGLYLCIKQLDSAMINGTISQEEKTIAANRTPDSFQWINDEPIKANWTYPQTELFNETFSFTRYDLQIASPNDIASESSLGVINITQDAIDSLIWRLNQTFQAEDLNRTVIEQFKSMTGIVTTDIQAENFREQNSYLYDPPSMQGLWSPAEPLQLETRFEALATSMTNSMRTAGNATVSGEEGTLITVLAVRWAWLSLPLACVLLGAVFLLIAIVETKRTQTPLWKADATALLFHSFETVPSSDVWDTSRLTQMEKVADETVVRLADTHGKGFFLEPVMTEMAGAATPTSPYVTSIRHSIARKPIPLQRPPNRSSSISTGVEAREPSEQSSLVSRIET